MTTNHKPNRLVSEKSPYLLQHAYNPVEWFPWSEEAFEKAKREDKPIFLSIGYSTCHWCHVMERESFEDEEVAELLNQHFVSIKVDREERPDVDHIYMSVCQAMTQHGGWPLTIIMTPEKKPFFAGTYFPKERKFGRMGLMELLEQVRKKWRDDRDKIIEIGEQITDITQRNELANVEGELEEGLLDKAYEQYERMFDDDYGGFGQAPKFPTPHNLSFLLRVYHRTGEEKALEMVEKTLDAMYRGGIYDHIGFGFARYSTDERWLVPHFEKMLYDNALLAITYAEAYQTTGHEKYAQIAKDILAYIRRDMTDPAGGFYSAEDADSEGVEGKFYVWKPEEVAGVLGREEAELFQDLYDMTERGNFEGHNIPNLIGINIEDFAERKGISLEELGTRIENSRQKLFEHREKRIHPHKDDKILTSWNGLMIAAFAKAAQAFGEEAYAEQAKGAAEFIWNSLRREDGRLLARFRDGEAAFPGYLDDYAFLIWGFIELYQATFELSYLKRALELNKDMIRLFWDEEKGGLFFYGSDAEQLIARPKEIYDGAIPAGNSVAALNFLRLARLTGDSRLEEYAERQFQAFGGSVSQYPIGYSVLMAALSFAVSDTREIVIVGDRKRPETQGFIRAVQSKFLPNTVVVVKDESEGNIADVIPYAAEHTTRGGKPTVYVCENFACLEPMVELEPFEQLLEKSPH